MRMFSKFKIEFFYKNVILHLDFGGVPLCRTPNSDMHLMLKSPSGKIPIKRDAAQPSETENVVNLYGGCSLVTGNKSSGHIGSDAYSVAARCLPHSTYDKKAKYKVPFHGSGQSLFDLVSLFESVLNFLTVKVMILNLIKLFLVLHLLSELIAMVCNRREG